jgi:5-methylcytosine-specific restriction enzyme subunit McrC
VRTITLKEHEVAPVGSAADEKSLTVAEAEALDRAQKTVGLEALRWTSRNQIRTAQYVGILVAPSVRLEILPKIDHLGLGETRHVLMRMLAIANDVPIYDGEITGHDSQERDLFELLIGLFAQKLRRTIRSGLSRSYISCSDDLLRLRGKLNVTRQFTRLAASPQTLASHFEEFTADVPLNRLLLCAVALLRRQSQCAETQRLLNELSTHFLDVQSIAPAEALMAQLAFNRANKNWKTLADLARLLLASIYQTAHSGTRSGISLLFDMNLLFETYVSELARRALSPLGYKVRAQGPRGSLARNLSGQLVFHTIPDLHLEKDGEVIILDTKWKRINASVRDFDVSQSDAYQMFGYAQTYNSCATVLLFPHTEDIARHPGMQTRWRFEIGGSSLVVATIDVARTTESESSLRQTVLASRT